MLEFPALLAYFGPESMLPMTSVVATVVGVFLMIGRAGWRFVLGGVLFRKRSSAPSALRGHHLGTRRHAPRPDAAVAQSFVAERAEAGSAESFE